MAILLDAIDGPVARATGSVSDFGYSIDTLADMVTCGAAPAALMYAAQLSQTGLACCPP
jgi:CDP-diacylglycerol--serine O-phosphatidyltransferase